MLTYFLAFTTQAMSSSEQFMHGGPLQDTSHRTFRVRHARQARAARRRFVAWVEAVEAVLARGFAGESRFADITIGFFLLLQLFGGVLYQIGCG